MAENICITEFSPEDFILSGDSLMIESSPGVFELTEEVSNYSADGTEKIRISFSGQYNKTSQPPPISSFYSTSIDFLLPEVPLNGSARALLIFSSTILTYNADGTINTSFGSNPTPDYDLRDGRWYTLKSTTEFEDTMDTGGVYRGTTTSRLLDPEGSVLEEGISGRGTVGEILSVAGLSAETGGSIPIKVRNLEFCAESIVDTPTSLLNEFSTPYGSGALIFGLYDRIHRDYENGVLDAEAISRANKALTYAYGGAYTSNDFNTPYNIYLGNIDI